MKKSNRRGIVLLLFVFVHFLGCRSFPYKIDPSGDCLFTKNDRSELPADTSPFVSQNVPAAQPSVPVVTDPRATLPPTGMTAIPGVNVIPGVPNASVVPALNVSPTPIPADRSTLAIPGSGPIMIVSPQEQIALVGSEIVVFGSYLGDDQYLRTGERVDWSLDGVGHLMTTNKNECGSYFFGNFTKDQKVSDRYAVASTTLYEGIIDRGASDQNGRIPVLAGQSWVAVQSAIEGTTTVTAMAPTIKDWQRRSDRTIIHWIDAEWIFPVSDLARQGEAKPITTIVKKRSSNTPSPNWMIRYEILGGPDAVFEPENSKIVERATDENGKATVNIRQLTSTSGTNTISVKVVRPAGVDGGARRLEFGSRSVSLTWTQDDVMAIEIKMPPTVTVNQPMKCQIVISNFSNVERSGTVSLPLPAWVTYMESVPAAEHSPAGMYGSEQTLFWTLSSIPARSKTTVIDFTIQPNNTAETASQLDLRPKLTYSTGPTGTTTPGSPGMDSGSTSGTISSPVGTPTYPVGGSEAPSSNSTSSNPENTVSPITITPTPSPTTPGFNVTANPQQLQGILDVSMQIPPSNRAGVPIEIPTTISNYGNVGLERDKGQLVFRGQEGLVNVNTETGQDLSTETWAPIRDDIMPNAPKKYYPQIRATAPGNYKLTVLLVVPNPNVSDTQRPYVTVASREYTVSVSGY